MSTQPAHSGSDDPTAPDDLRADVDDAARGAADDPAEATRAQFREALERKRNRQSAGGHGVSGDPKTHGTHGAAGGRRVFRRKSG